MVSAGNSQRGFLRSKNSREIWGGGEEGRERGEGEGEGERRGGGGGREEGRQG